jgi:lipoprotein NlpI
MRILHHFSLVILLCLSPALHAADEADALSAAQEKYRDGDFDGAIEKLKPLLNSVDLDPALKPRVKAVAFRTLEARGDKYFREGKIAESIADYDRQLELHPDQAPQHWKRGIAYYYAGEYDKGKKQFELHQTVNPQDVENAVWHFLCAVRAPKGSVEAARKNLIPITRDERIPMALVQKLFAGDATADEVLQTGKKAGGSAEFYAELYVGLYYEALGRDDESLPLLKRAAENAAGKNNFMGDVARTHVKLRGKSATNKSDTDKPAPKP